MTWTEIRKYVLRALDLNADLSSGDVFDQVTSELSRSLQELAIEARPRELYVKSSAFEVNNETTSITLANFSVTDLGAVYGLSINTNSSDDSVDAMWEELPWEAWLNLVSVERGNQRLSERWTFDGVNTFYLTNYPEGTTTWDAYLHYYKLPDAFDADEEPEFPKEHHYTIALKTITAFPQFFQGDRQILLAKYSADYKASRDRLIRAKGSVRGRTRMKLASDKSNRSVWPTTIF